MSISAARESQYAFENWDTARWANLRIIEAVGKRLRLEPAKVFVNIQKYGNTSAASIPIALTEAVDAGRVRRGDTLVSCAFGGGNDLGGRGRGVVRSAEDGRRCREGGSRDAGLVNRER